MIVGSFCVLRTMFKDGEFQSEIQLLKPVNMDLSIKRNLSASWYHSIPDNQINAHLKPMSVSVCLFMHLGTLYLVCIHV